MCDGGAFALLLFFVFDILIYLQIKSAGEAVGSSGRLEDLWNKVE